MKNIKIVVATHKKYQMPKKDTDIYMPIQVGKANKEAIGYQTDDIGDNISNKNENYSELTGLYWAWKNLKSDYLGLVHYRRYFTTSRNIPKEENEKFNIILNRAEIENLLDTTDIILPKKRHYVIENLYDHYKHTMIVGPLDETRNVIKDLCPEYLKEFDKLHKRTSGHMFNMFIMKKEYADEYCKWLFDILFELDKRVDKSKFDEFHARYLGRVSELLLDVWINTNKLDYKEVKVMNMENVNWLKKGVCFLRSKFLGIKYSESF